MKAILSPAGLILIALLLLVVFFPRRPPDVTKPLRKRMRAFPEEPKNSTEDAEETDADGHDSADSSGSG